MTDLQLRDGIMFGTGGRIVARVEDGHLVVELPGIWHEPWRVPLERIRVVVPGETSIVDGTEPALPILRTATARQDDLLGLVFDSPVQYPPPRAGFVDGGVAAARAGFLGTRNIYVRPEELAERGSTTGLSLQVQDRRVAIDGLLAHGTRVADAVPGRRSVRQGNVALRGAGALLGAWIAVTVLGLVAGLGPDMSLAIGMVAAPVAAALAVLSPRRT